MKLPRKTDVLVVGGGPVGLALAAYLRAADIDVVVVDRAPRGGGDSRAAILHLRTLELLAALGIGKALTAQGTPISNVAYFDTGVEVCEFNFAALESPQSHALGIQQWCVEQVLTERLEELGVAVRHRNALADIEQHDDKVVATIVGARGGHNRITAQYIVGCDGAQSSVRDLCGLKARKVGPEEVYAIADAPIRGEFERDTMHFYAADSGFAVVSPLPNNLWRMTASLSHIKRVPTREQLQLILNERGPRTSSVEIGPMTAVGSYSLRRMVASSLQSGRVLLAGDAAHTFNPSTAQGMNTGIADVANLAWKLAAVLHDTAHETLLKSYAVERRHAAREVAKRTDRYGSGLALGNPLARGLRDALGLLAGRVEQLRVPMMERLAGFDTHYEGGLIGPDRNEAGWGEVGKRVENLPRSMRGRATFRLLGKNRSEAGRLKTFARRWPMQIDVGVLPTGGKGYALVRPDDHIAWVGRERQLGELRKLLDEWFVTD